MTDALDLFLHRHGLLSIGVKYRAIPLSGGVSSEIWRVDLPESTICVKRALPRLKVSTEWHAPASRNSCEWEWLCFAAKSCPGAAPAPIAHSPEQHMLAMAYLDPQAYPLWKARLLEGRVECADAVSVGRLLAKLHAAGAHDVDLARRFHSDHIFFALRLDAYLLETARRHPDLAGAIGSIVDRTARTRLTVVHGDASPKNILIGRGGPILLDAEAAWYGDPAFDLAFCLNHFLLKCLARPDLRAAYLESFSALKDAYLSAVTWEPRHSLEARAASLLPALLLARVDGKSPVEYVTETVQKNLMRQTARPIIMRPPLELAEVARLWDSALARAISR